MLMRALEIAVIEKRMSLKKDTHMKTSASVMNTGKKYIPGNSMSPGYVKSYREKVSIPCNSERNAFNNYHHKNEPQTSYVKYKPAPKCIGSTTLGGLIGGGIAASLSKSDAYGWSIPLGAVLGAGLGNAECK